MWLQNKSIRARCQKKDFQENFLNHTFPTLIEMVQFKCENTRGLSFSMSIPISSKHKNISPV